MVGLSFLQTIFHWEELRTLKSPKRIIHLILWASLIISKNRPFFEIFIYFVPILAGWSIWSSCSHKCQVGSRSRSRTVVTVEKWGGRCPYQRRETGSCGTINGGCAQICNPSNGQCSCKAGYIAAGKVLIIVFGLFSLYSWFFKKKEYYWNTSRSNCWIPLHYCLNLSGVLWRTKYNRRYPYEN
mgnify:FL=1